MSMGGRIANEVNVTFHGPEHSQYFQGHGLSGTRWLDCATGIGESCAEAVEAALESLAQNGWEVTDGLLDNALKSKCGRDLERLKEDMDTDAHELHADCESESEFDDSHECELHYFVSIDVR